MTGISMFDQFKKMHGNSATNDFEKAIKELLESGELDKIVSLFSPMIPIFSNAILDPLIDGGVMRKMGKLYHELYTGLVEAGFTEEQALNLVKAHDPLDHLRKSLAK